MLQEKKRLPVLDFLRYFCAIAVLLWHYQHFFLANPDKKLPYLKIEDQPFWTLLQVPYKAGFNAVPLFWILSGVVLAKSYLVIDVKIKTFFVNRFARLYPLHFVTLLIILLLQILSDFFVGHPQIFNDNTAFNFFGNIFFLNGGTNYNAPVWSVTVEILCYIVFSFLVVCKRYKYHLSIVLVFIFLLISHLHLPNNSLMQLSIIGKCGVYFFSGVLLLLIAEKTNIYIFASFAILCLLFGLQNRDGSYFLVIIGIISFCLVIESCTNLNDVLSGWFEALGNLTYATYLVHVPLQILVLLGIQLIGFNQSRIVTSNLFFIFWFALLHFVSFAVYKFFELPAKFWVKRRFSSKNS
jgi:peptidoglycan/LPS O-acetylase OafA/YrhL